MTLNPIEKKPHTHAANMALFAEDAADIRDPWIRWEYYRDRSDEWVALVGLPSWQDNVAFRRKPKTITINGMRINAPLTTPPAEGCTYVTPSLTSTALVVNSVWRNSRVDTLNFERGLVHYTTHDAMRHANALLSFTASELTL